MPMNPDLEIIKSLNPDYVLSPATLQNDLQPKYAGAGKENPKALVPVGLPGSY